MAKEDTAEVNDEKYVFEKVLRRGVRHLEKLLKGYRHGLDLKKTTELAKLGDAIAISKSETMIHSMNDSFTD